MLLTGIIEKAERVKDIIIVELSIANGDDVSGRLICKKTFEQLKDAGFQVGATMKVEIECVPGDD